MKTVIITICVYSLILTLVNIYKDESSYSFGIETIDLVVGGPVLWVTFGFARLVLNPIYTCYQKYRKQHPKKKKVRHYTKKQIARIVKKILKAHLKACEKYREDYREEVFSFFENNFHYYSDFDGISLAKDLPFKSAKYEFLNRKYNYILNHQLADLLEILVSYFEVWTVEEYEKCDFDEYWIHKYKDETFYRLKDKKFW